MRFGGIVVAVAILLSGCSGDPEPKEPTARPTPTSTATLPEMPAQAKESGPEGAARFVDHWVDVFNYAAATGDTSELARLSSSSCAGCSEYIDLFDATYSNEGYFDGLVWAPSDFEVTESGSGADVFAKISAPVSFRTTGRGAKRIKSEAVETDLVFTIQRDRGDAQLVRLERTAK